MRVATLGMTAALAMAAAVTVMAAEEKAAPKPLIPCDKIVETYKTNNSVDETSDALFVDESRVAECLKAAGITAPAEDDD
jgi:hypothetical protein